MRRLWVLMMLFVLLPVCALAAPGMPYVPETLMQVAPLSEGARAVVGILYPALLSCQAQIDLPEGTLYTDADAAFQSLTRDYPELFHLETTCAIYYRQDRPEYAIQVQPGYLMTAAEYEGQRMRLVETAGQLVNSVSGTEAERAEALHDLLCERATYDESELLEADNTAVGALVDGVTRCEGYAKALALLYRMAGIPCGVVIGEGIDETGLSRHAWNVAVIEGIPTLIDATWNDRKDGGNTHWYYGLTDWMMAADHRPDSGQNIPACTSVMLNWHARRGLLVSGETGVYAALGRFAREGEVSVRFADAALYADFNARMNAWFQDYNARYPEEAFYGPYGVIYVDEQLCLRLRALEEEPDQ